MYTISVIWFLIFFAGVRRCKGPRAPFRHRRTFYFFLFYPRLALAFSPSNRSPATWVRFEKEEGEIEIIKEAVRGIRNVRSEMNVPPSRKAQVFVVSENENITNAFTEGKLFFEALAYASEVTIQKDKDGIAEDAVSVVIPNATLYIPFAELVDIKQEIERLQKEEKRLMGELSRVNGMLGNERFISKAPQAKIDEEKEKLQKYTQMMEQVKNRLQQLEGK